MNVILTVRYKNKEVGQMLVSVSTVDVDTKHFHLDVCPLYETVKGATCEQVAWAIHRCHANAIKWSAKTYRASMNDYIEQRDFCSAVMERWLSAIKLLNQIHLIDDRFSDNEY